MPALEFRWQAQSTARSIWSVCTGSSSIPRFPYTPGRSLRGHRSQVTHSAHCARIIFRATRASMTTSGHIFHLALYCNIGECFFISLSVKEMWDHGEKCPRYHRQEGHTRRQPERSKSLSSAMAVCINRGLRFASFLPLIGTRLFRNSFVSATHLFVGTCS